MLTLPFLSSCNQEVEYTPETDSDMIATTFRISMDQGLITSTDYIPMKSFEGLDNETKVVISNSYKAFIIKEVGTKWIIDKILTIRIDPDDIFDNKRHEVKENSIFHSFSIELCPGNYRMSIFTGCESLNWNNELKEGIIVADSADPTITTPWACTYKVIAGGYIFQGWPSLSEEIFTETIPFVIEKTEDLHSGAKSHEFSVNLHRMVTKLRILLKYEESSVGFNFFPSQPNHIVADIKTLGDKSFCAGLDIWGQPFYKNPLYESNEDEEYITNLKFVVSCWQSPYAPLKADNGYYYILGMYAGARQYSPFYFSDPNADNIPVEISCIEVSGSESFPVKFVYAYPEAQAFESPINIILKHNSIYGLVFKPGNNQWKDPRTSSLEDICMSMILETADDGNPVDARTIFDDFFEYRVKQIQP